MGEDRTAELFQRHGALVYRRALRLLGSAADAEEATQEIFIRVMRSVDRFEGRAELLSVSRRTVGNFLDHFLAWARQQPGCGAVPERRKA